MPAYACARVAAQVLLLQPAQVRVPLYLLYGYRCNLRSHFFTPAPSPFTFNI